MAASKLKNYKATSYPQIPGAEPQYFNGQLSAIQQSINSIQTGMQFSDINGTVEPSQLPTPTASTLGGIESIVPLAHNWVASIDTSGVPHQSQPAAADLSNGTTGSGAVVLATAPTLTAVWLGGAFTTGWGDIVQVWDATSGSPTTTAQPSLSIVKYEAISLIDTEGGQNAAIYSQVTSNNVSHSGGGAPITQANGIVSKATQNGTGGACAFFGTAVGGTDINAAFGGYFQAIATHFPGGAVGFGLDVFNSSGADMPWSAFVPGTSSATLGTDYSANGANLCTAAVEMRNAGAQWDVGVGAYGNSVKTALIKDDSNSATIVHATGSHTNGVDLSAATFSGDPFKSAGFSVDASGNVTALSYNTAAPAWTTYTPVVTAGSGTITTYSASGRYKQVGKTVTFSFYIVITTNGTGAGNITATLPVAANTTQAYVFAGRENAVSQNMLQAYVSSASNMQIYTYSNGYPGANGAVIVVSGTYEAA